MRRLVCRNIICTNKVLALRWTLFCLLLGISYLVTGCGGGASKVETPPPVPLSITSNVLPSGTVGSSFANPGFALTAAGGAPPYKWQWTGGENSSIPPGLYLSASGEISGTPSTAGSYSVEITVSDAEQPEAEVSAQFSLNIAGPETFAITSGAIPDGVVGVDYGQLTTEYFRCYWTPVLGWHQVCTQCASLSACAQYPPCQNVFSLTPCLETRQVFAGFTMTAIGGVRPYTWMASGLPPSLSVDSASGQITGTPTTAGGYSVTVTVTDAAVPQNQTSVTYAMNVASSSE